jgi:hypothetical protein
MVGLQISPFSCKKVDVHYQVNKLVRDVGQITLLSPKYPFYLKNNEMGDLEKHMG